MTRALLKNTLREIWNTKARFLSILAIIALGVGFFAGIKATPPSMYRLAEDYYREIRLMDFRLVSTTGFSEDDIQAVSDTAGVESVMPSYFCDVLTASGEGGDIIRVIALPKGYRNNPALNSVVVREGRSIENSGEILTESVAFANHRYQVGGSVHFAPVAGDNALSDMLTCSEFQIVGKVESPLYISYQRGNTTIGNGKIDEYMDISSEDFAFPRYTELYVKAALPDDLSPFSDNYQDRIEKIKERLEQTAREREKAFQIEVIDEANAQLNDAKKTYQTEKENADRQLRDAEKQLKDGEQEYRDKIADGEAQLDDARAQIADGEEKYYDAEQEYSSKIAAAEKQLNEKSGELNQAEKLYNQSVRDAEKQLADAQAQINSGWEQYNASLAEFKDKEELFGYLEKAQKALHRITDALRATDAEQLAKQLHSILDAANEMLKKLQEEKTLTPEQAERVKALLDRCEKLIADTQKLLDNTAALLEKAQNALDELDAQYHQIEEQLAQAERDLINAQNELDKKAADGKASLDEARAQLDSGRAQLTAARGELDIQKKSGRDQLNTAFRELEAAKAKLANGNEVLESERAKGREKLDNARKELDSKSGEADKKFREAKASIDEAAAEVGKLSPSVWYTFTRTDNPGYDSYPSNADRLDAVASVFPLFFLLVAVLVCVTTMTRLIEEKRVEIATLKALGYGNGSIILKYVIYAVLAAAAGSVLGITAGMLSLPFIIYDAYRIMFYIGNITLVPHMPSIVLGILAAVVTTAAVSVIVCLKSLHEKPAQAMRPKAPKAGKRILLEYLTPIWKRMSFTKKLTARNLFRYKIRMLMTVIGVAGCTALIVAAFGLLNSFVPLTETQFREIYHYDAVVVPKNSGTAEGLAYLEKLVSESGNTEDMMLACQEQLTVSFNGKENKESTYLQVTQSPECFERMMTLRTRVGQHPLTLDDNSVLINEWLANRLGISVGDVITLKTDNREAEAKVGGIYEQYIYSYVILTPRCYESLFGSAPEYNMLDIRLSDNSAEAQEEFSVRLLNDSRIVAVSFLNQNVNDFKNMLNALNMVVVVMIVCASGLAFVVLYNLTNINIAERVREIATCKVLGFYNNETSRFIYRENILLTMIGIAAGLVLGVFLTGFIIRTVEVDNVMFGRDIYFSTYVYASLLTMAFSLLVNFFMSFKIKAVNMVESLKSVE